MPSLCHGLEESLCGDEGTREVDVEHALKLLHLHVEEGLSRRNGCPWHVASCGIEQCIYAPIEAYHLIAHLVDSLDVGHIAHHESGVPTLLADVFGQLFAYVLSASQQNNLGTFACQM